MSESMWMVSESRKSLLRGTLAVVLILLLGMLLSDPWLGLRYRPALSISSDPNVNQLLQAIFDADVGRVRHIVNRQQPDLNNLNSWGLTPLTYALVTIRGAERQEIVRLLVDRGADVNRPDAWGHTPLMWTVSVGDADMAEVLLRAGADANVRRPDGSTVLHIAAHSDAEPAIARMLLAAGADPTVRDREGKTPADYARDDHLTELAAILEPSAAGAVVSANAPVIH